MPDLSGAALAEMSRKTSLDHWQADGFYRMLTKMLFKAPDPTNATACSNASTRCPMH